MKILIADDDRVLTHLLGAAFRKRGWTVVQAFDAMQSVMFAQQQPRPDVILLDLAMPGGTGIKALERLRASARTTDIPVIVMSATEDTALVRQVEDLGVARFLPKPVDPGQVADIVQQVARGDGGAA